MSDEEKKEYEELKSLLYQGTISQYGKRKLIDIIEKQSKEIEKLKEIYQSGYLNGCVSKSYEINKKWKDKIKANIEEYKKQIEKMEKEDIGIGFTLGKEWSDLKAKVEFGQLLLEKE